MLVVCLIRFRHSGHARAVGGMRVGQPGVGHGLSMGVPSFCIWVCLRVRSCVKSFFFVACVLLCALLFALLCFVCVGVVLGGARGG